MGIGGPDTALTKENIQILFLGGSPQGESGRGTSGGIWRSSEDAHDDARLSEALEAGLSTSRDSGGSCLVAGRGGASQRCGLWGSAGPGGPGWTGGAGGHMAA